MTVINLRGTSAAGKTTIVRRLIETAPVARPIYGSLGWKRPEAIKLHGPQRPLFCLGPYPASGADAIVSQLGVQGVVALLDKYSARGDVLFEALIISSMFGAVGEWLRVHPPAIVAVLDATLAECAAGLRERQGDRQRAVKTQAEHHHRTLAVTERMRALGMTVETLNRECAVERISGWLK
jgi:hypothetical protein